MKIKRLTALLLVLALCASLAAGCAAPDASTVPAAEEQVASPIPNSENEPESELVQTPEPSKAYTAGTYKAEARGRNGTIVIETVFDDESIVSIEVVESIETANIGDIAESTTIEHILSEQSLVMDTVTGATITQNALITAVKDCVEQAGGDPEALMIETEAEQPSDDITELNTDVVVVGAGLSGMMAAISAARGGAEVILVERLAYVGGNSMLSSGAFHVGATDLQAAAGIEDNVDSFVSDMLAKAEGQGGSRREEIVRMVGENGNASINWLIENGVAFSPEITAGMGDSLPRYTRATDGMPAMFNTLSAVAENEGVQLMLETTAVEINTDENNAAIGIDAVGKNGEKYAITAKSTILAAGGYRANEELTVKYTGYANLTYCGSPGAKGEMLDNAISLGAATEYLDIPYLSPTYNKASLTAITSIMLSKGGILLDNDGERYCNEPKSYRDTALSTLELGQEMNTVYEVLGENVREAEPTFVEKYMSLGIVTEYATLADMAEGLGVDEAVMSASIDRYNAAVRGEAEDEFGRDIFADELKAPYYVIEVSPGGNLSGGGLLTDGACRVIMKNGSVFDNLYAVGETSGAGGVRAWGYAGGDSLTFCAVSGMVAGFDAAANVK